MPTCSWSPYLQHIATKPPQPATMKSAAPATAASVPTPHAGGLEVALRRRAAHLRELSPHVPGRVARPVRVPGRPCPDRGLQRCSASQAVHRRSRQDSSNSSSAAIAAIVAATCRAGLSAFGLPTVSANRPAGAGRQHDTHAGRKRLPHAGGDTHTPSS